MLGFFPAGAVALGSTQVIASAVVFGTVTGFTVENNVRDGGVTVVITLTGETFITV